MKLRDWIIIVIGVLLTLAAVTFYLVTVNSLKPEVDKIALLNEGIDAIEVVYELDNAYEEPDFMMWGRGVIVVDEDFNELEAMFFDTTRVAGISISYSEALISKKLTIDSINIMYMDLEIEISVDVTWTDFEDDQVYKYDGTEIDLRDYLLTLTPYDIYRLLLERELITK